MTKRDLCWAVGCIVLLAIGYFAGGKMAYKDATDEADRRVGLARLGEEQAKVEAAKADLGILSINEQLKMVARSNQFAVSLQGVLTELQANSSITKEGKAELLRGMSTALKDYKEAMETLAKDAFNEKATSFVKRFPALNSDYMDSLSALMRDRSKRAN